MTNRLLVRFNSTNIGYNADLGEKAGNIGLGLLRIGFGKTITVEKSQKDPGKNIFNEKVYSTSAKIAAIALFILALPITLLFTGIGCAGVAFSKTHKQIFTSYVRFKVSPHNEPPQHSSFKKNKKTERNVRFGNTQTLLFTKENPPKKILELESIIVENLNATECNTEIVNKLNIVEERKIGQNNYLLFSQKEN